MIGQVAVASAFALVGIASQHAHSLFDELLSGFVLWGGRAARPHCGGQGQLTAVGAASVRCARNAA